MRMNKPSFSGATLSGLLLLISLAAGAQSGQPSATTLLNSTQTLRFDMPAQTLDDALREYSRVSGLSVLLDGQSPIQKAPAVHGQMTRKQALAGLLAGSELHAFFVNERFIVVRAPDNSVLPESSAPPALALNDISGIRTAQDDYRHYVVQIQQVLLNALCPSPVTRPGNYRLALQVWLDPQGRLQRVKLLGSTGSAERDAAIERRLIHLAVGTVPPERMPQPVVVLLVPVAQSVAPACQASGFQP